MLGIVGHLEDPLGMTVWLNSINSIKKEDETNFITHIFGAQKSTSEKHGGGGGIAT